MFEKMRNCDDTCVCCIPIGEGDFFCDRCKEVVISDYIPLNGICIAEPKKKRKKKRKRK